MNGRESIMDGKTALGIEFGSTRIKAVLIDSNYEMLASGSYEWENSLINNIWTYGIDEIWKGLQGCYKSLTENVKQKYDTELINIGSIGFSGMMHGYMVFNDKNELLVPFRTWRNTMTKRAAEELTHEFNFNIPQRWSIAHLYEAILSNETHVKNIAFQTTLAGYIHWKLTGEKCLGVGEASGMLPIDSSTGKFNEKMLDTFDKLIEQKNYPWKIRDILPNVLSAGEAAGYLTKEGAKLLDVSGKLNAGIPFCPPEGDAGTGMTATNSVAVGTGNVSAGTSVFGMVVLEKMLSRVYSEIDLVTTPTGHAVAMVHCNNCTSDLNSWVALFKEFAENMGIQADIGKIYEMLYNKALEGDSDCGGLLSYNYFSGEHITDFEAGRPLFVRSPGSCFNLSNFIRVNLFTALGALKVGLDILLKKENVHIKRVFGHGGLFKTKRVGQQILSAAINAPVSVMETAGEGGAWGIAVLALYMMARAEDETLEDYLNNKVFAETGCTTIEPDENDVKGFETFIERYKKGLAIERAAIDNLL